VQTPIVYTSNNFSFTLDETNIRKRCSIEHVIPQSFLQKCHQYDMHNMVKTDRELNTIRSNYKFVDTMDKCDEKWIPLKYENYVNHKKRMFIPNESSRGLISRSILYMITEYDYSIKKVIDKDVLIKWYHKYPPCEKELYHNQIVREIQKTNNIFISSYNKKSKVINRILEKL